MVLDSVPILLFIALLTLIFGQDHPAGEWSQRHTLPATSLASCPAVYADHTLETLQEEKIRRDAKNVEQDDVQVYYVGAEQGNDVEANTSMTLDVAVNEPLTWETASKILLNPVTWLPALAYLSTFGLELTIDGQMANVLFSLFSQRVKGFDQNKAGYYTSIL